MGGQSTLHLRRVIHMTVTFLDLTSQLNNTHTHFHCRQMECTSTDDPQHGTDILVPKYTTDSTNKHSEPQALTGLRSGLVCCFFCLTCRTLLPEKLKSRRFWLPHCLRSPTAKSCTFLLRTWGQENTRQDPSVTARPKFSIALWLMYIIKIYMYTKPFLQSSLFPWIQQFLLQSLLYTMVVNPPPTHHLKSPLTHKVCVCVFCRYF